MKARVVTSSQELAGAWARQYEKVARVFAELLGSKPRRMAEIGCGSGQLTIPLARRAVNLCFVLVDRFADTLHGSYSHNYKRLESNLEKARLKCRSAIVVSDYLQWLHCQPDESFDVIISSEFLPEIDSSGTHEFIQACYRLLRFGGMTLHTFLSPVARNPRQRLLILADSNPLWTNTPPKEWFSPKPELIISELRKAGFRGIRKSVVNSNLIMKGNAAKSWLKDGEIKATFYAKHKKQLNNDGLEVPDWIIVSGKKP